MSKRCQECGKIVDFYAKRCRKCYSKLLKKTRKGKNNSCWRGGSSVTFCIDCGKQVVTFKFKKKRCLECYLKTKWGKTNTNWRGGKSFEPYASAFNQQLKDRIRVRDNFICQLCRVPELECKTKLNIHHIDYDKENNSKDNLICLCRVCNAKVNFGRKKWQQYFLKIQNF